MFRNKRSHFISSLRHHSHKYWLLFVLAWMITLVLYLPAYRAGYEGDFWGWLYYQKHHSFLECVNRMGFDVQSLYQVTMAELWVLTELFGSQPWPWFFLQTALHSLNAVLLGKLFFQLQITWQILSAKRNALYSGALFLLACVQVETVIWKGSFHYLTGLCMILLILNCTLTHALNPQRKYAWFAICIFLISCFTLEIFYLTPIFIFLLLGALRQANKISSRAFKRCLIQLLLPIVFIFCGYFLLYYFTYGAGLAHYDLKITEQFAPDFFLPKWSLYISQILLLFGYYGEQLNRFLITHIFYQPVFYFSFTGLCTFISVFLAWRFKKLSAETQLNLFLFICTLGALFIVSPLWYFNDFAVRNGHYAYLASAFLFPLFVGLINAVKISNRLTRVIFVAYLLVQITCSIKQIWIYRKAGHVFQAVVENFPKAEKATSSTKLLLNLPALYKGILVLPADTVDQFQLLHHLYSADSLQGEFYSISSFNMNHPSDGAHVTVLDEATIKVTLNQWGTWWWFRMLGAFNYENNVYRLAFTDPGHEYVLHLKQPWKDIDLFYFSGGQWKKVNRELLHDEQW